MDIMEEDKADSTTKVLVEGVIEELKTKKKSKQKQQQSKVETGEDRRERKGMTLSEIEIEETGGTVRESEVGMAHIKRAVKRKGKGVTIDETELVANVEDAEEEIEDDAREDATNEEVELTAFNLKEERESGYFDEDGHYVERKDKDEDATDAWLESTEANMASAEVRRSHEARLKAMEEADKTVEDFSESTIAALKGKAAKFLLEGETVTRALKRLGGGSKKPVLKSKNKRKAQEAQGGGGNEANQAAFLELAELVDNLVAAGEVDIYTELKHQMEREAQLFARPTLLDSKGDSDGDDMFADESDEEGGKPPAKKKAFDTKPVGAAAGSIQEVGFNDRQAEVAPITATQAEAGPGPSAGGAAAPSGSSADYSSWPVKELRRFLQERAVDSSSVVEKSELVELARGAGEAGAANAAPGGVPVGYLYHADSGYYWGEADSMYFEAASGCYYSPVTREWFRRDPASGDFVPVKAGEAQGL